MKLKRILLLTCILFLVQFLGYSQNKKLNHYLLFEVETSFYENESKYFKTFPFQTTVNYKLGWMFTYPTHKSLFFQSGLNVLRRKNENPLAFDHCRDQSICTLVLIFTRNNEYYLSSIPITFQIEQALSERITFYGAIGGHLYLNLFTIHGPEKTKINYWNFYGASADLKIGIKRKLFERWSLNVEIGSRILESYREEEILYGDPEKFEQHQFENINATLSINYQL